MGYFNTTHLNQALTNVSVRYNWGEGIADMVFPEVPVQKEANSYFVYDADNLRMDETLRANRTEANTTGFDLSTSSYRLEEHALKELVSDRDRMNADAPLSLDIDATMHLTEKILVRREFETALLCFTTTTWGQNATVGSATAWNTSVSNPISDILTATSAVLLNGFIKPNRAVVGWQPFALLKINSVTTDRIKYTSRDSITPEIMAGLWELETVLVGMSARNSNAEGVAASSSFLWGKDCLVYYAAGAPSLRSPSAGYMLTINGRFRTKKWREEKLDGDYIETSSMFLPVAVATNAAYLLKRVDHS